MHPRISHAKRAVFLTSLILMTFPVGCSDGGSEQVSSGNSVSRDAGAERDAKPPPPPPRDAGVFPDAGHDGATRHDAAVEDANITDSSTQDVANQDAQAGGDASTDASADAQDAQSDGGPSTDASVDAQTDAAADSGQQDACIPTTCAAAGAECGTIGDGCGGTLECGTCSFPQTCGGGGTPHMCGCTSTACKNPGTGQSMCNASPGLTSAETNIARAYFGLLGRAPDAEGLKYWVAQLGTNVTLADAADAIHGALAGAHIPPATYDLHRYVEAIYVNMLGKNADDDPSGVNFWVSNASGKSRGQLLAAIYQAAINYGSGYGWETIQNREKTLDCAVRLEKKYGLTTSRYEDTLTVIHRVTNESQSIDLALDDYWDLVRPSAPARPTVALDQPYTQAVLYAAGRTKTFDGASARHFRRMVWWNRSGDSLWAYAVMPMTYQSKSDWPAIVFAHGGGWREGMPDDLQIYATRLAALGYMVFLPAYRLTALPGYSTPAAQNDLADFVKIIEDNAGTLGIDASKVAVAGLSSGGHLAVLLGSQANYHCVAALFPPTDLADSNLLPGMPWYVNEYLGGQSASSVSPVSVYANHGTWFYIQHSKNDPLVPYAESVAFKNKGGTMVTLQTFAACPDSGGTSSSCGLHGAKGYLGSDRDKSISGLDSFFKNTCGF